MNDYQATPVQWSRLQQRYLGGNDLVCAVLELHARVEVLDKRCEVQLMQLSDLQDRHHRLTLRVGHLEHELVRDDDEPQQYCLEAMDPPEANSKPTPNPSQIRSSLVKRVAATLHRVTDSDPNVPVNEWKPGHKEDDFIDGWILLNPKWAGSRRDSDDSLIYTHWLPANVLPTPEAND